MRRRLRCLISGKAQLERSITRFGMRTEVGTKRDAQFASGLRGKRGTFSEPTNADTRSATIPISSDHRLAVVTIFSLLPRRSSSERSNAAGVQSLFGERPGSAHQSVAGQVCSAVGQGSALQPLRQRLPNRQQEPHLVGLQSQNFPRECILFKW